MQPEWAQALVQDGQGAARSVADGRLARSDVAYDGALAADATIDRIDPAPVGNPGRIPFATRAKAALVAADMLATICAMTIATPITAWITGRDPSDWHSLVPSILISLPIWPVLYAHQGLYQSRKVARRLEEVRRIVNAVMAGVVVLAGISVLLQDTLSRGWLVTVGICLTAAMVGERELARRVIHEFRARGVMTRRVVVVGRNEEAAELAAALGDHPELGYDVVGFVADAPLHPVIDLRDGHTPGEDLGPYLGPTTEVLALVRATAATGVIVATTGVDQESANQLVRDLTREGLFVEMTSAMRDIASSRISVRPLGRYPVICVEPVAQLSWRRVAKRAFDIVASSLLLLVVSPILAASAAAIRITSGRGVIFRQERVGKDGEPFRLYKLRTMVPDAEARLAELQVHNEAAGPMFKMTDDPRVTSVGRFLRASSIDELPQLFNVIKGDMSLVGPRPALPNEADQWDDTLRERLRVQPGITGMWQVSGRYTASLETYARLDLYYVDNWSFVTDMAILLRTLAVIVRRHGGA